MGSSLRPIAAWGAIAMVAASCGGSATPDPEFADVVMSAAVSGTQATVIVVRVSAPDIPTPILFNLRVVDGFASDNLKVPAGRARTFTAAVFDRAGEITHEGQAVIDVRQGANPPAAIALVPKAGRLPLTLQVGPVGVQVVPGTATVLVGGTVQLAATVRAAGGQVVALALDWATANPAIAGVTSGGLVGCASPGVVEIQAVAEGVPGVATITCNEPPASAAIEEGVLP